MAMLSLEQITVRGDALALGRGQGEAMRERVRAFIAMRFDAADKYMRERGRAGGLEALKEAGKKSALVHEAWDPDGYREHLGIAEGAAVLSDELFTATNMTDLRDVVLLGAPSGPKLGRSVEEGCSSVLVPPSHTKDGAPLAGQTWDLNPEDVDYVVAVHRLPVGQPETWSIVCTGCLTIMGMNAEGVAVGTTNIKTYGSEPGVGYLGVLHRALREQFARDASKVVRGAPVAAAHTYWIADEHEQVEWEASPNGQYMRSASGGPVVRSNHCLASTHLALEGEAPTSSSRARFARLDGILRAGGVDVDALRTAFADRSDGVDSVNRYAEDGQGTATNAVFIADPVRKKAYACRGPADRGAWVELRFGG